MTQHFEISTKELDDRLDVNYYLIRDNTNNIVKANRTLKDVCRPIRTKTPSRESYTENGGIPCLKLRNITGSILDVTNCDNALNNIESRFILAKPEDILITATGEGTAGRCDIFLESGNYLVTGENILLRPTKGSINPFFLLAILRSSLVSSQLRHYVRGATGQTHLYWQDISNIFIPDSTTNIDNQCEEHYKSAWQKRNLASQKLNEAKAVIRRFANEKRFNFDQRCTSFEINFLDTEEKSRLDVDYFQPIYLELEEYMSSANCVRLSEVVVPNHATYNPGIYPTKEFLYIDIDGINTQTGDYTTSNLLGYQAPTRARRKPNSGDIIISTVRPNRNAVAIIGDCTDIVVSTGFSVLTPQNIHPYVLFAMLKTDLVYHQIVRHSRAAMYPAVTETDILEAYVPILSESDSTHVIRLVGESIQLRKESDVHLSLFSQLGENCLSIA